MKSCCITGHRNIPEDKIEYVYKELKTTVLEAICDGYYNYISGFAPGTDIIFAQLPPWKETYASLKFNCGKNKNSSSA